MLRCSLVLRSGEAAHVRCFARLELLTTIAPASDLLKQEHGGHGHGEETRPSLDHGTRYAPAARPAVARYERRSSRRSLMSARFVEGTQSVQTRVFAAKERQREYVPLTSRSMRHAPLCRMQAFTLQSATCAGDAHRWYRPCGTHNTDPMTTTR